MPKETFHIRIKRDGTIRFGTEGLSAERTRLLREMLEDCLGPAKEIKNSEGNPPSPGVLIADRKKDQLKNKH